MYLYSPPMHATRPVYLVLLDLTTRWDLVRGTNHEALHYAVSYSLQSFPTSQAQISPSAPNSQTTLAYVLP